MNNIAPPIHTSSRIREVWIELDDYHFRHNHLGHRANNPDITGEDDFFIGRHAVKERLKMLLRHSTSPSGAYLVTGFRGMGKTSLVHKALNELAAEQPERPFERISISLSQDEVQDTDVLRQMARQLYLNWERLAQRPEYRKRGWTTIALTAGILCAGSLLAGAFVYWGDCINWVNDVTSGKMTWGKVIFVLALLLTALAAISLLLRFWRLYSPELRGYQSWKGIRNRLAELNARLDARLSREDNLNVSPEITHEVLGDDAIFRFRLFEKSRRKSLAFEIASPKEIEKELLNILSDIHEYRDFIERKAGRWRRSFLFLRRVPEFLFIVDELDKIEPSFFNRDFSSDTSSNAGEASESDSLLRVRRRQEAVARLLANLKSFLNEALAKFIFIGGREMYDAALADIADRDAFYGSIFHDVIYVNSFFKDRLKNRAGVTRMAEAYLCKLLIPKAYAVAFWAKERERKTGIDTKKGRLTGPVQQPESLAEIAELDETFNLNTVFHYLVDAINAQRRKAPLFADARLSDLPPGEHNHLKIFKIIFLLQNFVIFLTYRSNGAPKKLSALLERYLETERDRKPAAGKDHIVVEAICNHPHSGSPGNKLFLRLKFDQQYEIGLTSNLYRPYIIMHSRYLKALGDKLLYSTAFIMDYLLKFHPFGFSWRNVELIPEAILTNKDPNLRQFIRDLVRFLGQIHIRETLNGMLQYKFYSKVTAEIRYVSKISDLSAAAFNFTLDESLQIKNYYLRQLDHLYVRHRDSKSFEGDNSFVHSICFLHLNLGDLYYFDQEFDKAILHFTDAIQPLRMRMESGVLTNHQIVLLTRAQLRLGMCLEKIQAFDSAYSLYRSLIIHLPRLLEKTGAQQDDDPASALLLPGEEEADNPHATAPEDKPLRRMQLFLRPHIAILDLIEKQRHDGITFSNLRRNITEINKLLNKDRGNPLEGKAPERHPNPTDSIRLNTLYADYYQNVGSILYYKNRSFPELYEFMRQGFFPNDGLPATLAGFLQRNAHGRNDYNPPLSAFAYYLLSLTEQLKSFRKYLQEEHAGLALPASGNHAPDLYVRDAMSDFERATWLLHPEMTYLTNSLQLYSMGNLISKMGDCLLACANPEALPVRPEILGLYASPEGDEIQQTLYRACQLIRERTFPFSDSVNSALVLYRVAGLFYMKSGRNFSYVFQYKKLLFVMKDHLLVNGALLKAQSVKDALFLPGTNGEQLPVERFLNVIVGKMFQAVTWMSENSNRPQSLKYREMLHLEREDYTATLYNNLSTSPETREIMLLVEEIRLKLNRLGVPTGRISLGDVLTPYDTISNKFLRMIELRYKAGYNYAWFGQEGFAGLFHPDFNPGQIRFRFKFGNYHAHRILVREMVEDSIFCLYEVIRTLNIYGINYVTNHSYLASVHQKMGAWCQALKNLGICDEKLSERIRNTEKRRHAAPREDKGDNAHVFYERLGIEAYNLEPNYHFELAAQHYHAALQTHNGGRAYKENVTNMSFLEDDFNDNLTHFCAATERYRINTGAIRNKINALKKQIGDTTQVYDAQVYWKNARDNAVSRTLP